MQGKALISLFKNKIYAKEFQIFHKIGQNSFIRDRKLPFQVVFSMILKLVKKSLAIECELLEPSELKTPPSKQAFSKARYKIRHTGFKELLEVSLQEAYKEPDYGTWRGYRLIAADGSSLRLPDSKENVAEFGRFKPNGTNGTMPPLARVSLFVDLCTSMICSARIAAWNIGEQTLAQEQLPEVVTKMQSLNQKKILFIYDRGYPSIKFIKQHDALQVDYLFRLQTKAYANIWQRVEQGEKDFDIIINNQQDSTETVRIIVVALPNGKTEVLLSSLKDRELYSSEDISKIYILRWHIEECYKRLKIGTEIENFSGINFEAILQEFWAHMVMCNVLSVHMCEAQGPWDPEKVSKYRLNFSILFGVMRNKLFEVLTGSCDPDIFQKLFDRAALRAKVKIRPGRLYSREGVGKPKRHHVFRRVC